jgi:hypothetical protein
MNKFDKLDHYMEVGEGVTKVKNSLSNFKIRFLSDRVSPDRILQIFVCQALPPAGLWECNGILDSKELIQSRRKIEIAEEKSTPDERRSQKHDCASCGG